MRSPDTGLMTSFKDYKRRDYYGTGERPRKGSGQPEA